MEKQATYFIKNTKSKDGMINSARRYLEDTEHMETQIVRDATGTMVCLQARVRHGKIKQVLGMDRALTIRFAQKDDVVTVGIGEAKWSDKAVVMTTSMFILWPLAVTSAFGIYKQKTLPGKIINAIERYLYSDII